ncbi:MAG: acyltransferase family protein [Opitutaceae bacterium]|jgi:peptidoglycan/LPS O-acetylase OafA/YrhL
MSKTGPGYRADIDGLRAIAIIGVVVFHLCPNLLPGGFLGVDVFFVISGFLITTILQKSIDDDRFSLVDFYERRIRRIIPALFVLFFILSLGACWLLLPPDLMAFGKSMRYAVISLSNFHFLNNSHDYFNDAGSGVPLLHTWSLAVEEQFYLIFPFVLLLLNKFSRSVRRKSAVLAGLLVVSYAAGLWMMRENAMSAFYLLPFRAWELMMGACIAVGKLPVPSHGWSHALGGVGLCLVAGSMVFLNDANLITWGGAMLPCLGAVFLIYAGGEGVAGRFLSVRPMVFVGLISYSVYLWHWPLIIFSKAFYPDTAAIWAPLVCVSFFTGWVSWRFVECPFRDRSWMSRKVVFAGWLAASVLLLGFDYTINKIDGWPGRYSDQVRHYLSFKSSSNAVKNETKSHYDPARAVKYGDLSVEPTIAVWGDSHAGALVPELDLMARASNKSFLFFGTSAQAPVPGVVLVDQSNGAKREKYTEDTLKLLIARPHIKVVVLHARWGFYAKGRNERSTPSHWAFYGHSFGSQDELEAYYTAKILAVISALTDAGKTVVLIYPVPEVGYNVPDFLARQSAAGKSVQSTVRCLDFQERQSGVMAALDSPRGHIIRIKPHERLLAGDQLTILHDGNPLYRDDDHLSTAGVDYIKDMLEPIFQDQTE